MKIEKVGHLAVRVSNLDEAVSYYCDVLGFADVARGDFGQGSMAFLSTGNSHHDIVLVEASSVSNRRESRLHHLALKVGDDRDQLIGAKAHLESLGAPVHAAMEHGVSQSIYTTDPDGNLIELYIDVPGEAWRDDPALVARADPMEL